MTNYFNILGLLMFLISLLSFVTRSKHIISMLLSLEMMALGIFLSLSSVILMKGSESFIIIPFLTLTVCEGSLGLSLLVKMTRFFGNDFLKTTNLIKY